MIGRSYCQHLISLVGQETIARYHVTNKKKIGSPSDNFVQYILKPTCKFWAFGFLRPQLTIPKMQSIKDNEKLSQTSKTASVWNDLPLDIKNSNFQDRVKSRLTTVVSRLCYS